MVEHDDADDFGRELVDELMANVDETSFDKYIERQLVPYTLHTVVNHVLDVVDVCTLN